MTRARGARSVLAAAFETTYGTAPGSGFFRLPFASATLGTQQDLLPNELLGYGRDPLAPILDVETTDGNIVVPLDTESFGFWLTATFGEETASGTDPYTYAFSSGEWEIPSLSIEKHLPDATIYEMLTGIKVNSLGFSVQQGGELQATIDLIGQGSSIASSSAAGSLTSYALNRFGQFHGAITRGGSALASVVSADFNYNNNLDAVRTIRADGKIDGADPAMATCTGTMRVRVVDATLLAAGEAGTIASLGMSFTKGSYSVTFAMPQVSISRPRLAIEGPGGVDVTFDWQASQDTDGSAMLDVTYVGETAAYAVP